MCCLCSLVSAIFYQVGAVEPRINLYDLDLKVDFERSHFTGREILHFTNQSKKSIDTLFFRLYPNLTSEKKDSTEPALRILTVKGNGHAYRFETNQEVLKVFLPESLGPDQVAAITIEYAGHVPLVTESRTNTLAHVMRELSSATVREPAVRLGYETFLRSEDVMVLGFAYPVLAMQNGQRWQSSAPVTMAELEFTETADYRVRITTQRGLTVIASGPERRQQSPYADEQIIESSGDMMREFAIIIGRNLVSSETNVGKTKVRSVFREKDSTVGKNLLKKAADAVSIYSSLFGEYPYPKLDVVEAPLLPGHSECEFSGMVLMASAYYIDFKSPAAKSLPGFLREQAPAFEDGFEYTAIHGIAHQWWGEVVEVAPYRHSFMDEALTGVSSVIYLRRQYDKGFVNQQLDSQVNASYRVYRTFGGSDMSADKSLNDFVNEFQFAAIVQTKGTLFFVAVLDLMGEKNLGAALARFYEKYKFRIATPDDLLNELNQDLTSADRDTIHRIYRRWLHDKHGDEDIGKPPMEIQITLDSDPKRSQRKLTRMGRFFLMIGKTAVRPF